MIDIRNPTATPLPNRLRIPDKPRRSIIVHAALPLVVRCLTSDDNLRTLRNIRLRSVADVLIESVHFLAGLARSADLVAGAGAVAAAVVVGVVRRAAVVVAEFDHDDVVGFEERSDLGEAAFVRVAAGGAATDGFVDDGCACGEERGDVGAPAWRMVLVSLFLGIFRDGLGGCTIGDTVVGAVLGHGAVAGEIYRGIGELEGRSQSGESNCYSHVGWKVGVRERSDVERYRQIDGQLFEGCKGSQQHQRLHPSYIYQNRKATTLHHPTQPRSLTALVHPSATT